MENKSDFFYATAKSCSMKFVKENISNVYFVCAMSILAFIVIAIGGLLHSDDWIATGFSLFVWEIIWCFLIISDMKKVRRLIKMADDIHFEEILEKCEKEKLRSDNKKPQKNNMKVVRKQKQ